jgi:hypothetical protein
MATISRDEVLVHAEGVSKLIRARKQRCGLTNATGVLKIIVRDPAYRAPKKA